MTYHDLCHDSWRVSWRVSWLLLTIAHPHALRNISHSLTLDFITISHLLQTLSFLLHYLILILFLYYYGYHLVYILLGLPFRVYTISFYYFIVFLRASAMLKHVIAIGWTSVCPSVCLSVRLSHAGTLSKRLNILSCFLHHTIAHSF